MRSFVGAAVGAGLGLGWYAVVGCSTGTCWITSDPRVSAAYFGFVGWLVAGGGAKLAALRVAIEGRWGR